MGIGSSKTTLKPEGKELAKDEEARNPDIERISISDNTDVLVPGQTGKSLKTKAEGKMPVYQTRSNSEMDKAVGAITDAEKNLKLYREQKESFTPGSPNKHKKVSPTEKTMYKTSDVYESNTNSDTFQKNRPSPGQRNTTSTAKRDFENVNQQGSYLVSNYSQHCPVLLEKRKIAVDPTLPTDIQSTDGGGRVANIKPVMPGRLGIDGSKIRSELTKQGILDPATTYGSNEVDPREQSILGELRQVGIIKPPTDDQSRYSLSIGSPVRKPPPRLTQLPPLGKDIGGDLAKMLFAETDAPPKDFRKKVPSLNLTNENKKDEEDFFGNFSDKEKVGDAGKLKMLDLDIL